MRNLCLVISACVIGTLGCSKSPPPRTVATTAACERLTDVDQTVSRLLTSGEAYDAGEATTTAPGGGYFGPSTEIIRTGAEIRLHAQPGVTAPYLQRVLECHAAYGRRLHPNDPFHPANGFVTSVAVFPAGNSYIVQLAGSDANANDEILERARTLTARSSAEQVSARNSPASF